MPFFLNGANTVELMAGTNADECMHACTTHVQWHIHQTELVTTISHSPQANSIKMFIFLIYLTELSTSAPKSSKSSMTSSHIKAQKEHLTMP